MNKSLVLACWLVAAGCVHAADAQPPGTTGPAGWSSTGSSQPSGAPANASPNTAVSGSPAAADREQSGQDPLPPPRSALYQQAQDSVSVLSPEETRELMKLKAERDKALATEAVAVVPKISALTIDLSPGASVPLVRTAVNYPSSVTFIDSTGAPWKLGAAPISGNPDFTVYWVPNSPVMVVYASQPYRSGNVTVYLEGLAVPISFNVSSGEPDSKSKTWTVDSRLDARIPRRGPGALAGAAPESRIGLHDDTLQAFLDGVPPKAARRLKVTGNVPDAAVWQLGDDLYVRSTADIRDEFEATLSSADGTHLWKLPMTPYLSFSVMGRTAALNVALE